MEQIITPILVLIFAAAFAELLLCPRYFFIEVHRNPHNNSMKYILLLFILTWGNWGTGRLSYLSNSISLWSGDGDCVSLIKDNGQPISTIFIIKVLILNQQDLCQDKFPGHTEHSIWYACPTLPQSALLSPGRTFVKCVSISKESEMHSKILKYLRQTRSYNLKTGDITVYMSGVCITKKIPFLFGSHAFF